MAILKLDRLNDDGEPLGYPQVLYVNANHIESWRGGVPGVTTLWMVSGQVWVVAIAAGDLAAAIDPENICPDPPGQCGYYTHYLVYGGPDLTHAGFHAAVKLADEHGRACRVYESGRVCPTCQRNEERIRA